MKVLIVFLIVTASHISTAETFFDRADTFFKKHVKEGLVDYKAIKKNPDELKNLVNQIAQFPLNISGDTEKKAFLINAYNLLVIQQIVEHYPIEGPLKIEGFFDETQLKVAGMIQTLNSLEKEMLMGSFPDARLHFVLVCAAIGCPPLANFAYQPEVLEKQISDRTKKVLNFALFIRVNNEKVGISKIFEWYQSDFLEDNKTIASYIDEYREQKISGKLLTYYEYDWTLNEL